MDQGKLEAERAHLRSRLAAVEAQLRQLRGGLADDGAEAQGADGGCASLEVGADSVDRAREEGADDGCAEAAELVARVREVEERSRMLAAAFANSPSCLVLLDPQFNVVRVSEMYAKVCGMPVEELVGRNYFADCPSEELRAVFEEVVRRKEPWQADARLCALPGCSESGASYWDLSVVPILDDKGEVAQLLFSLQDVTERTRVEQEKRAMIDVLQLVNLTHDLHELASALIAHIQEWTGCEAAALRLREGDDFPFFATAGFPEELLAAENSLCGFNEKGEILRDEEGRPLLECMCGRVLCHTLDDPKPYLTDHGSFCVASSRQFVIDYQDDLPDRMRGTCVEQGYESIAIVPLRLYDQPFGLLHLCDRRPGLFDESTMTVLEGLADNLAVALAHGRAQRDLMRHQDSLRALASQLAITEEQERLRVATVLHDDLCQSLALARMRLGDLRQLGLPAPAQEVSAEIEELLSEAISFTRNLTVELSPPALQELGLAEALRWLVERVASRHGLRAECTCEEECSAGARIDTIVFRSVRELLTNVVKHARATVVQLRVECTDEVVRVSLSDDGVGFDAAQSQVTQEQGGFGLFSIREGLAYLGGHLEVRSSPGRGTVCILTVPRCRPTSQPEG
ncbi:MAG: ATP-binding protein [Armatimonadota bacterium]